MRSSSAPARLDCNDSKQARSLEKSTAFARGCMVECRGLSSGLAPSRRFDVRGEISLSNYLGAHCEFRACLAELVPCKGKFLELLAQITHAAHHAYSSLFRYQTAEESGEAVTSAEGKVLTTGPGAQREGGGGGRGEATRDKVD